MRIEQIYTGCLAQGAYYIVSNGEAAIIDPLRETKPYLERLEKDGVQLKYIFETHFHADFVSGHLDLSKATGAPIIYGPNANPEYDAIIAEDGQFFELGGVSFKVLHTPGHTMESTTYLLRDENGKDHAIFSGDTLFLGDVGRPDLAQKAASMTQEELAGTLYESLMTKIMPLADDVTVYPAHGAGSACGKALTTVPRSTVGYEKIRNWAFQYDTDEKGFVDYLLEGQPEPPKYFAMMKHLNKVNRPLLVEVPKHPKLSKEQFLSAYRDGLKVIDARNKADFANGYIPNSVNIQGNNSFSTWCGWVLNYQEQFILVADDHQIEDLTRKLMRIGLDNIYGYISDIDSLGLELQKADVIDIEMFKSFIDKDNAQIVDVRGVSEFEKGHIKGADNVFVGTLQDNLDKFDKNKQIVIHCQSGDRASIAYSLLKKNGFENVKNYSGGMKEWLEKGNNITVK
jgi:hydroxyacylglutathione hydrolase